MRYDSGIRIGESESTAADDVAIEQRRWREWVMDVDRLRRRIRYVALCREARLIIEGQVSTEEQALRCDWDTGASQSVAELAGNLSDEADGD